MQDELTRAESSSPVDGSEPYHAARRASSMQRHDWEMDQEPMELDPPPSGPSNESSVPGQTEVEEPEIIATRFRRIHLRLNKRKAARIMH
jgi:hypothetical protein